MDFWEIPSFNKVLFVDLKAQNLNFPILKYVWKSSQKLVWIIIWTLKILTTFSMKMQIKTLKIKYLTI